MSCRFTGVLIGEVTVEIFRFLACSPSFWVLVVFALLTWPPNFFVPAEGDRSALKEADEDPTAVLFLAGSCVFGVASIGTASEGLEVHDGREGLEIKRLRPDLP